MRKAPAIAMLIIAALAVTSAVPGVLGQTRAPVGAGTGAASDDMPHRTAKMFAPFLKALINRRYNTAQSIFKIHRNVETSLEQEDYARILTRFNKPDRLDLNLVGGRTLGTNIGILFFTIATEDGPVALKIYYYGFGNDIIISRLQMTDDWDEIETLSTNLEILQTPVTVSLGTPQDPAQ